MDREQYEELVRIERSTAELQGRDPDQAEAIVAARVASTAQREERDRRVGQARELHLAKQRAARLRVLKIGVAVVVVGAAAVPTTRYLVERAERADAFRRQLNSASAAAAPVGFTTKEQWLAVGPDGVELKIAAGSCSAVVAVREGSDEKVLLRIDRGPLGQIQGNGGRIWCSCEAERAVVAVVDPGAANYAIGWLSVPAPAVGGLDVLSDTTPEGFTVYGGELDRSCADAAFAEWSATAGHGDLDRASAGRAPSIAALEGLGFEFVGQLSEGRRLGVIRLESGHCYLAIPIGQAGEVTLRGQQGKRLLEATPRPVGWCTYGDAPTASLWREPGQAGERLVLRVAAPKIGGLVGLREAALSAGLEAFEIVADGALSVDDVVATLVASTVTESTIVRATSRGLPAMPERKLLAITSRQGSALEPGASPAVPIGCWPGADVTGPLAARTCVQASAQPWQVTGASEGVAAAAADLPFWLMVLGDATEPEALVAVARSLAVARHLTLLGFEPTTTAGVQETPTGARVGGVVGTKEFVAFAVTRAKPWVHPLTAGKPWQFGGPVQVTPLSPEATVEVRAAGALGAEPSGRRVVVWRR